MNRFVSAQIDKYTRQGLGVIGIVGVYLSKIFIEIKRRPYTIVRHIYQKNAILSDKKRIALLDS
jgi:hypothetical protein